MKINIVSTFVDLFKDFLGKGAEIVIEHVNESSAFGKRKVIANNYIKRKGKEGAKPYVARLMRLSTGNVTAEKDFIKNNKNRISDMWRLLC